MMVIEQIRLANFKYLLDVKYAGSVADFARSLNRDITSVHRYVASHSQRRDISSKAAREIEQRTKKSEGWLDLIHIECEPYYPEPVNKNVKFTELKGRPVPILEAEQILLYVRGKGMAVVVDEYIPSTLDAAPENQIATVVSNDSMSPRIPEGAVVLIELKNNASHGEIVLATDENGDPQCKQFVVDGSDKFLKPLNPQYPTKRFTKGCQVLGIVREVRIRI